MKLSIGAARGLIRAVGAGLILLIVALTLGRDNGNQAFGPCLSGELFADPICRAWTLQAIFEILAVIAFGIGALVYNQRRPPRQAK
jgi:hypothetical protein